MERTTANLRGKAPLDQTPRYTLTVLSGPAKGTRLQLRQPRTVIGRSTAADLTIDEAHLSRYHIEIELLPGERGLLIRDLHSANGTYIRNCRIIEAFVDEQCTIEIGEGTLIEVSLPYEHVTGCSQHLEGLAPARLRDIARQRSTTSRAPEPPSTLREPATTPLEPLLGRERGAPWKPDGGDHG